MHHAETGEKAGFPASLLRCSANAGGLSSFQLRCSPGPLGGHEAGAALVSCAMHESTRGTLHLAMGSSSMWESPTPPGAAPMPGASSFGVSSFALHVRGLVAGVVSAVLARGCWLRRQSDLGAGRHEEAPEEEQAPGCTARPCCCKDRGDGEGQDQQGHQPCTTWIAGGLAVPLIPYLS